MAAAVATGGRRHALTVAVAAAAGGALPLPQWQAQWQAGTTGDRLIMMKMMMKMKTPGRSRKRGSSWRGTAGRLLSLAGCRAGSGTG